MLSLADRRTVRTTAAGLRLPLAAGAAALAVAIALWLAYGAMLGNGFVFDDWQHLEGILRNPAGAYARLTLDPRLPHYFYRPAARLVMYGQYALLGLPAGGYHLTSLLLHAANAVLWGCLLAALTRRLLLLPVAALAFAVFPLFADAVLWVSDTEILLALFFGLLCLLLWLRFVQSGSWLVYGAALLCLALALLSKEVSVFLLPVMLALNLAAGRRVTPALYILPLLLLGVYLAIDLTVVARDVPLLGGAYRPGLHSVQTLLRYLLLLASPLLGWQPASPAAVVGLLAALAGAAWLWRRERVATSFLLAWIVCSLAPYAGFSDRLTERYMYAAALGATGLLALAACVLWDAWRMSAPLRLALAAACLIVLAVFVNDVRARQLMFAATTNTQNNIVAHLRTRHDAFAAGSALYFLNAPAAGRYLAAMLHVRFDLSLRVGAVDEGALPEPAAGAPVYVFAYRDGVLQEMVFAGPLPAVAAEQVLPVRFAPTMSLAGYDVPAGALEPGKPLLVLLYWQALGPADRSYTAFVHLVDENWNMWAQSDSLPQEGLAPTDQWQAGQFVGDAHLLPVPADLPPGGRYRLEIGLYDANTMQRASVVNEQGAPVNDRLLIGPLATR